MTLSDDFLHSEQSQLLFGGVVISKLEGEFGAGVLFVALAFAAVVAVAPVAAAVISMSRGVACVLL